MPHLGISFEPPRYRVQDESVIPSTYLCRWGDFDMYLKKFTEDDADLLIIHGNDPTPQTRLVMQVYRAPYTSWQLVTVSKADSDIIRRELQRTGRPRSAAHNFGYSTQANYAVQTLNRYLKLSKGELQEHTGDALERLACK